MSNVIPKLIQSYAFPSVEPDQILPIHCHVSESSSIYVGIQCLSSTIGHIQDNLGHIYNKANTMSYNTLFYFDYTSVATIEHVTAINYNDPINVEVIIMYNTASNSISNVIETQNLGNSFNLSLTCHDNTFGLIFISSQPGPSPFVKLSAL